jgi:hypothetical protein
MALEYSKSAEIIVHRLTKSGSFVKGDMKPKAAANYR